MNKKIPPIHRDRDFEYIDIVLMFDEATKRVEKLNSNKTVFKIALLFIAIQAITTIGIIYYFENYSPKTSYEVIGKKFYNTFENLDKDDQAEIISLLNKKT